ncbi:MAG: four helix bundle protein [Deltaproteobacteria bacterium]|nr:four helix bundle protein [Deltaproteobacteria bacterium]
MSIENVGVGVSENKNKKEIRCVKDLEVYKKAHNFTLRLYKITSLTLTHLTIDLWKKIIKFSVL